MPHNRTCALLMLALANLTGCSLMTNPTCTDEWVPGIVLEVVDSITSEPAGRGALIVATSGSYADTVRHMDGVDFPSYGLAHERAGTYVVTVEHEGYRPWSRSGVRVEKEVCHVRTVELTARLQR